MIRKDIILCGALVSIIISFGFLLVTKHPEPMTATVGLILLWIGISIKDKNSE